MGGYWHESDGFLELAATNEIIMVYPESQCWNSNNSVPQRDGDYLTKDGLYPKALKAMICRLTSTEGSTDCPTGSMELASAAFAALVSLMILQ